MTNETIEKELYVAPKVEVYSLEVEGAILTASNGFGEANGDFAGEFGRSCEGSFGNSRF